MPIGAALHALLHTKKETMKFYSIIMQAGIDANIRHIP